MKIIIFEGVDKVGKTTAINELVELFPTIGLKPIKLNVPFSCDLKTKDEHAMRLFLTYHNLEEMDKFFDDTHVCLVDRLHISEKVFGDVLRNEYDKLSFNNADYFLNNLKAVLIHIVADDIWENYQKFCDEDGLIDGLTKMQYLKTHEEFISTCAQSKIKRNITVKSSEIRQMLNLLKFILN